MDYLFRLYSIVFGCWYHPRIRFLTSVCHHRVSIVNWYTHRKFTSFVDDPLVSKPNFRVTTQKSRKNTPFKDTLYTGSRFLPQTPPSPQIDRVLADFGDLATLTAFSEPNCEVYAI